MGQISLPVLNRTGYSMFWQSVWDEKHNYNRGLKEDILLRRVLSLFFYDRMVHKRHFVNYDVIENSSILYDLDSWSVFKDNKHLYIHFLNSLKKKNNTPYYVLKVWILKFQTWVVIFFSLYVPSRKSLSDKLKKKSFNLYSFLGYQYLFLSSVKFNKLYFKNTKYTHYTF
jgi:hypothetical protein